jgi:hypothetical protein
MFKTSPELTAARQRVVEALCMIPIGGIATYAALSEAAGLDVAKHRYVLKSAIADAEEETRGRFATVHKQGIKRLEATDLPSIGARGFKSIHRTAKTTAERLTGFGANDVPSETRIVLDSQRSLLGAIVAMSSRPRAPRIERRELVLVLPAAPKKKKVG